MRSTKPKKLNLKVEIIKSLDDKKLEAVAGGVGIGTERCVSGRSPGGYSKACATSA
jgi:hypothetical protein